MMELYEDGVINDKLIEIIKEYGEDTIDAAINHENDYNFDYIFGNILEQELDEMWYSEKHVETIDRAYNNICTKCSASVTK